jgi:hypothetical protein
MDNASPGFEADIRPLFRESDRRAMTFRFDLWDLEDVRSNAADILAAVAEGDMPCDGEWPEDRVALFKAWMEGGFAP